MKLGRTALACLALALAQIAVSAQAPGGIVAEGFRDGPLDCFSSKAAAEQACDRDTFEFPQEAQAEGWFIVLRDRTGRSWHFRRADVMLAAASDEETPVRVPGNDTESGVRQ